MCLTDILMIIGIILGVISIIFLLLLFLKKEIKNRWRVTSVSSLVASLLLIFIPLSINYTDKNFSTRSDSSFVNDIKNNEFETNLYELSKKEFDKDKDLLEYIPSSLFNEEGEKYYLGNKYGFYINTNDSFESDVLIFSINVDLLDGYLEDNFNRVSISINKEISNKYKYIDGNTLELIKEIDNYYLGSTNYYLGIKNTINLKDKYIRLGNIIENGRYSNISNAPHNNEYPYLNAISTNGTFNIDKENNVDNIEIAFNTNKNEDKLTSSISSESENNLILFRPNVTTQNTTYGGLVKEFSFSSTYEDELLINKSDVNFYIEYTDFSDIKDIVVGINLDVLFDNSEKVNFNTFNKGKVETLASFSRYYTLNEFYL